jgi:L-ribulose-5-phosphate 4-epimerase
MLEQLKEDVFTANKALVTSGLVILTWGNVSGISKDRRHVVIKPSGVSYDGMTSNQMVVVDLNGNVVEGNLKPSSDTPTHLRLYKEWGDISGICHTHSTYATAFAQACRPIPCLGTTHADLFFGEVPVSRVLTPAEVSSRYELNTGDVIVQTFQDKNPVEFPGVLAANHGPFTWGASAGQAVTNAMALEEVAKMAALTLQIAPQAPPIPSYILNKHYTRKHGPDATYGQK